MKDFQEIIKQIRAQGYRVTKTRQGILELLAEYRKPVAAADIGSLLEGRGIAVNKTTVYRELDFLSEKNYIEEVRFSDGRRYYEVSSDHHHHLVCVRCRGIDDVVLENEFSKEEERIERSIGFKVLSHSLEFFGVCARCR